MPAYRLPLDGGLARVPSRKPGYIIMFLLAPDRAMKAHAGRRMAKLICRTIHYRRGLYRYDALPGGIITIPTAVRPVNEDVSTLWTQTADHVPVHDLTPTTAQLRSRITPANGPSVRPAASYAGALA